MTFLLDVNVLIALGWKQHEHNESAVSWAENHPDATLATCPLTELGFVRILSQKTAYDVSFVEAKELLARWKSSLGIRHLFFVDDHDIARLPDWVNTSKQITDGHIYKLAVANNATLATFDRDIPGAHLIR